MTNLYGLWENMLIWGDKMLDYAFMLLMNSLLFMLRISPTDSFPKPLSKEEEAEYLSRWAEGDIEARNALVEHNLRLVAHIMKKYYTREDTEDLISIGTIGLIKAINSYKPDKGVRLATYASRCIENEILMYFRSRKKTAGDISLSDALDVDGEGLSLMDVVSQEDDMAERIGRGELCEALKDCIDDTLSQREAKIIRLRYGIGGSQEKTQREVAELCHISRSYVSRIEKKALEKLRAALGGE